MDTVLVPILWNKSSPLHRIVLHLQRSAAKRSSRTRGSASHSAFPRLLLPSLQPPSCSIRGPRTRRAPPCPRLRPSTGRQPTGPLPEPQPQEHVYRRRAGPSPNRGTRRVSGCATADPNPPPLRTAGLPGGQTTGTEAGLGGIPFLSNSSPTESTIQQPALTYGSPVQRELLPISPHPFPPFPRPTLPSAFH